MRYITTILCAIAFAIAGISLATMENKVTMQKHMTISAATVPDCRIYDLPLDLQLDLKNKYNKTDTVYIPSDTVFVEKQIARKCTRKHIGAYAAIKRQGLSIPAPEPDSIVNNICVVREEKTTDSIGPPKASIILTVDGEEVYKR